MKKILQALLIVIFLHSSISYGLCSDINKAWINFNNGNFKEAIPIFENLCNRERDKEACIGLGIAYRDGKGKSKDLNKAIELFNPFLDDVYVKFLLAQLYEYDLGTIDSLNKAFSLYKNIGNTEDRNLEIKVNSAFKRLPVYQF